MLVYILRVEMDSFSFSGNGSFAVSFESVDLFTEYDGFVIIGGFVSNPSLVLEVVRWLGSVTMTRYIDLDSISIERWVRMLIYSYVLSKGFALALLRFFHDEQCGDVKHHSLDSSHQICVANAEFTNEYQMFDTSLVCNLFSEGVGHCPSWFVDQDGMIKEGSNSFVKLIEGALGMNSQNEAIDCMVFERMPHRGLAGFLDTIVNGCIVFVLNGLGRHLPWANLSVGRFARVKSTDSSFDNEFCCDFGDWCLDLPFYMPSTVCIKIGMMGMVTICRAEKYTTNEDIDSCHATELGTDFMFNMEINVSRAGMHSRLTLIDGVGHTRWAWYGCWVDGSGLQETQRGYSTQNLHAIWRGWGRIIAEIAFFMNNGSCGAVYPYDLARTFDIMQWSRDEDKHGLVCDNEEEGRYMVNSEVRGCCCSEADEEVGPDLGWEPGGSTYFIDYWALL